MVHEGLRPLLPFRLPDRSHHRDERLLERPLGEEPPEHVRKPERDIERVRFDRRAEEPRDQHVPDHARDPGDQREERNRGGRSEETHTEGNQLRNRASHLRPQCSHLSAGKQKKNEEVYRAAASKLH